MTGFEPQASSVGGKPSANWATSTDLLSHNFTLHQSDPIWRFLKVLADKFLTKVAQIFGDVLCTTSHLC